MKSSEASTAANLTSNSVHELKLLSNEKNISSERLEYEIATKYNYPTELYPTEPSTTDDAGDGTSPMPTSKMTTTDAVSPDVVEKGNQMSQFSTRVTDGYTKHPCLRECIFGESPMTCHYNFDIERYYAMSKACHNCSTNMSDCYRQDCVTTDGVKRAIVTVNRILPGPAIEVR